LTFWSALDDWNIEFRDGGLLNNIDSIPAITSLTVPLGWDDALRLAGGAEYWARDNLTLRGGMYWESGAAVDETFNLNLPDVGDKFGVTGGFAYTINERWEVALAQEIAQYSDRSVASIDGQDGTETFPGDFSLTRWETLISLEYRF
jgi:long-subunit fatty acid transport protein